MVQNSLISQHKSFTFPRARELASEQTSKQSEQTDEQVAQYWCLDFWSFGTTVFSFSFLLDLVNKNNDNWNQERETGKNSQHQIPFVWLVWEMNSSVRFILRIARQSDQTWDAFCLRVSKAPLNRGNNKKVRKKRKCRKDTTAYREMHCRIWMVTKLVRPVIRACFQTHSLG